jgi:hypothetical protein
MAIDYSAKSTWSGKLNAYGFNSSEMQLVLHIGETDMPVKIIEVLRLTR